METFWFAAWLLIDRTLSRPESGRYWKKEAPGEQGRVRTQALGCTTLVLGAWGCGAFGNDARHTAGDFREALEDGFQGAFSDVPSSDGPMTRAREALGEL